MGTQAGGFQRTLDTESGAAASEACASLGQPPPAGTAGPLQADSSPLTRSRMTRLTLILILILDPGPGPGLR